MPSPSPASVLRPVVARGARPFLAVLALSAALAAPSVAQIADFTPQEADLVIAIVNGTTGEPGRAESLEVRGRNVGDEPVLDVGVVSGTATFEDRPVVNFKRYLVTAVNGGVAYYAEARGQDFLDGKTITVHVFDQTDALDGVSSPGMNAVARWQEHGLALEYVVQVVNESRPPRTVAASALPVRVALPPQVTNLEAEFYDGPRPVGVPVRPAGAGRFGVEVALPPGAASVTIRGLLPGAAAPELELGAELPVAAWSLLVFPADARVDAPDLSPMPDDAQPAYARYQGPPLAAGQTVRAILAATTSVATAEDAFRHETRPPADARGRGAGGGGGRPFPWPALVAGLVILAVAIGWWRRR